MKISNRLNQEKGFALPEILISLMVGTVILVALTQFTVSQFNIFTLQEQVTGLQQNGRIGIEVMLREFRMAGYDPAGTAGAAIVTADASSFGFTTDLNGDGDVADASENITYSLFDSDSDGNQDLGRTDGGTQDVVAENIQSLSFLYTLADGSTTTTPTDLTQVRRVDVSVTARTARSDPNYSQNGGHRTLTVSGVAQLRSIEYQSS